MARCPRLGGRRQRRWRSCNEQESVRQRPAIRQRRAGRSPRIPVAAGRRHDGDRGWAARRLRRQSRQPDGLVIQLDGHSRLVRGSVEQFVIQFLVVVELIVEQFVVELVVIEFVVALVVQQLVELLVEPLVQLVVQLEVEQLEVELEFLEVEQFVLERRARLG